MQSRKVQKLAGNVVQECHEERHSVKTSGSSIEKLMQMDVEFLDAKDYLNVLGRLIIQIMAPGGRRRGEHRVARGRHLNF